MNTDVITNPQVSQPSKIDDAVCVRDIEISDNCILHIAEQHALEDDPGACIWDSALVLCHFLIKQHELRRKLVAGKRVIELGSGTGAVGLTAAAIGASEVVLTDKEHLVPHLNSNIQHNKMSNVVAAVAWEWTQPLPAELQPPYDVILCSDVIYSRSMVQQVLAAIKALSGPHTVIYISCEFREGAGLEQFHELMAVEEQQLHVQLVPYTELHEEWCSPDILVWQVTTLSLQPNAEQAAHQSAASQ